MFLEIMKSVYTFTLIFMSSRAIIPEDDVHSLHAISGNNCHDFLCKKVNAFCFWTYHELCNLLIWRTHWIFVFPMFGHLIDPAQMSKIIENSYPSKIFFIFIICIKSSRFVENNFFNWWYVSYSDYQYNCCY